MKPFFRRKLFHAFARTAFFPSCVTFLPQLFTKPLSSTNCREFVELLHYTFIAATVIRTFSIQQPPKTVKLLSIILHQTYLGTLVLPTSAIIGMSNCPSYHTHTLQVRECFFGGKSTGKIKSSNDNLVPCTRRGFDRLKLFFNF